MSEELEIHISPRGAMTIEASGHIGAGCLTELAVILKDLEKDGIETNIKNQKKKQEYYAAASEQTISSKQ